MIGDGEEKVPCETCGEPTSMTGTKRCDQCWEVERRLAAYLAAGGDKACRFVAEALRVRDWLVPDRGFGAGVPGLIAEECYRVRDMLHGKNAAYGNSALDPLRCFSKADPEEQIRVRLDDKLSRLMRGDPARNNGEDVIADLLGYLILLRVARRLNAAKEAEQLEAALDRKEAP